MNKAWMREIEVKFTSKKIKKQITFKDKDVNLSIEVSGVKHMSTLKDTCTIKITNLTYSQIISLIAGEYYDVEVFAGYRNGNVPMMFKGGVLYISDELQSDRSHIAIILCTSSIVAKYSQKRLNLSLNSGVNIYSALKFLCERAQIPNANINPSLKQKILTEISSVNDTPANYIDKLTNINDTFIVDSDETTGNVFSIYDYNYNKRIINITVDMIDFTGGPPRLTSSGLSITIMPTINLRCGDIIKIDNSILNISASTIQEARQYTANYLDKEGKYMIYQIEYQFENRGSGFSLSLECKTLSLFQNIVGG